MPTPTILSIAVIIRTQNRPHLLTRCLQSLVEQLRQPDEVVVVNDGGADVKAQIDKFKTTLNVNLLQFPQANGRAQAGNMGVGATQCTTFAFLDDDDRYFPDHLQRLEQAFLQFDAQIAYSGCQLVKRDLLGDEDNKVQTEVIGVYNDGFDAERLRHENYIPLINLLIDKSVWNKIGGFDTNFDLFEDWDALLRLAQHTKFYHLERVTSEYAVWGNSQATQSSDGHRWIKAYKQFLAKHLMPLPDGEKLNLLAKYWRLSQERRGLVKTSQDQQQRLQLELAEKQNKLAELRHRLMDIQQQKQDYQIHYERVEQELKTQNQAWQATLDKQTAEHSQQQQAMQQMLEKHIAEHGQQQQALKEQAADYQQQIQVTQQALETQHHEFKQQQADLQAHYDELSEAQQALQIHAQQQQDVITTLQTQLHETNKQLIQGMMQSRLEKILLAQKPQYTHAMTASNLSVYFEALLAWFEQQAQPLYAKHAQTQQQLQALQADLAALREPLREFTDKAMLSRWQHYFGYIKMLDCINIQVDNLDQHLQDTLQASLHLPTLRLTPSLAEHPIPPPRHLSGVYPSLVSYAGEPPQVMHAAQQRGATAFHLGLDTALAFTLACNQAHFCRLDVALATYQRLNCCQLRMVIRALGQIEPLRVVTSNAMTVLDNAYHTMQFEPLPHSAGQVYHIELDCPDADEHNALAVWCQREQLPELPQFSVAENQLATLPNWLQQGVLDLPLAPVLRVEIAQHLFLIAAPQAVLPLQVWLTRMGKAVTEARTSAKIVVCGELNEVVQAYCEAKQIATLPSSHLSDSLAWAANQSGELVWLSDVNSLPEVDIILRAEDVFANTPAVAALVPLQIYQQQVSGAYALIDAYGRLQSTALGLPADHPSLGYRRNVEATHSPLLTLCQASLRHVNLKQLDDYLTPVYQLTDLLWQMQAQNKRAIYDGSMRYQDADILASWDEEAYVDDAAVFFQCWNTTLSNNTTRHFLPVDPHNPEQRPTVLIVDATLPTYDEDSGSLRLYTLMKIMVSMGYKVTFFPDNLDSNFKYRYALESLGVEVFHGSYVFADVLADHHFDYAIVCRVDIGQRYLSFLRLVSPQTKIFYDTVDIHYVREQRQAEIEHNLALTRHAQETRRKELANCITADCTLTVTDDDGQHLRQELPNLDYFVLPNVHEQPPESKNGFAARDGLVFIGNYNHQPNEDAVYFFVEQVLPKIHAQLPDVKLYLLGSNMKPAMRELASEYIKVIGWVDQVPPAFELRRVFVSYLRYGAGMKGKLGQALSLGLPVVSTLIGAEGMGLVDGETALIADDPDSFATAVCRLYRDEALWDKLSAQGRDYIEEHYGETAIRRILTEMFGQGD